MWGANLNIDYEMYSPKYKQVYGELIQEYRSILKIELGKPKLGWKTMLRMIMAPEIEQGMDIENSELTESDLKNWFDKNGGPVGGTKFRYIARFINDLDRKKKLIGARRKINHRLKNQYQNTLSFIHGLPDSAPLHREIISISHNRTYFALDKSRHTLHILTLGTCIGGVFDFTIFHHPTNGRLDLSHFVLSSGFPSLNAAQQLIRQIEDSQDTIWTDGFAVMMIENQEFVFNPDIIDFALHCRSQRSNGHSQRLSPLTKSTMMALSSKSLTVYKPCLTIFDTEEPHSQSDHVNDAVIFRPINPDPETEKKHILTNWK